MEFRLSYIIGMVQTKIVLAPQLVVHVPNLIEIRLVDLEMKHADRESCKYLTFPFPRKGI
jgi:hypothetical protein